MHTVDHHTVGREPLIAIFGQLGFLFDGERIHVRLIAPNSKLIHALTSEDDKKRRKAWLKKDYAREYQQRRQKRLT